MKINKVFLGTIIVIICLFFIGLLGENAHGKTIENQEDVKVEQEKEPDNDAEDTEEEKEPDESVLKEFTVEAGTKELAKEWFYSEYTGQEFEQITILSEDDLKNTKRGEFLVTIKSDGLVYFTLVKIEDTTAPVIEGVKNKKIAEGDGVSYKNGVTVTDNSLEEIELVIDSSKMNSKKAGTYPVVYSATDSSGNTTSVEITVTVEKEPEINEAYVRPMVEKIVNKVTNSSMTDWEKAKALYDWCRANITYGAKGDRNSIWTGAYEGVYKRQGDCYAYYATYAAMLEIVGIPNMKVARVGGTSNHWWNLVNVGNGWYHCDTSPRRKGDKYVCFMQTDAQIAAYTESYKEKPNYYTFDTSAYPERETVIVYGK